MMASFYLLLRDYKKGYTVMNTVQERYRRAGEIFSHVECGDHYCQVKYDHGIRTVSCTCGSLSADEIYVGERLTGETIGLKAGESAIIEA